MTALTHEEFGIRLIDTWMEHDTYHSNHIMDQFAVEYRANWADVVIDYFNIPEDTTCDCEYEGNHFCRDYVYSLMQDFEGTPEELYDILTIFSSKISEQYKDQPRPWK